MRLLSSIAKLFTGNPVIGGFLALVLLQATAFGIQTWKLGQRSEQLEDMTDLRQQERDNHRQTKANFRAAMAQAKLDQAAAIAARESEWRKQSDATETQIRTELGSALAAADAYVARLRNAGKAGAGAAGDPGRTEAAGIAAPATQPAGPGGMSQLDADDVRICTVNTVEYRQLKALFEGLRAESLKPAASK